MINSWSCLQCGVDISGLHHNSKYCSEICKNKYKEFICFECKKISSKPRYFNNIILCPVCTELRKMEICIKCNRLMKMGKRMENGILCRWCYAKSRKEKCSICNKIQTVISRDDNGKSICCQCRRQQLKEKCFICQIIKVVNKRIDYKPVCLNCSNYYNLGFSVNTIRNKLLKHKKPWHTVFEYLYPDFNHEMSILRLVENNIVENKNYNLRLKYDYFDFNKNIAIELNEPCHYNLDIFLLCCKNQKNENDFLNYQNNFKIKEQIAKDNNIKLIIIDIEYKQTFQWYSDRILGVMKSTNY